MIRPIVLAAGLGTRMGAVKALLPIDGRPALCVVLDTIRAAGLNSPIVVLGHRESEIRDSIDLRSCTIVINDRPESGMSRSLRLGIDAAERQGASGLLVFHVDMPYVTESTVRAVLEAVDAGSALVAPSYGDKRGFPVYFGAAHFEGLRTSLGGDAGGHRYLADHDAELVRVPVNDPGSVSDIDRPSDLGGRKGELLCAISE